MVGIFIFIIGTFLGSFANVCIYRLPKGESIVTPRSRCPNCGKLLTAVELVPAISWVILRGRCRKCDATISARYPLVELLSGLLLFATYTRFGLSLDFVIFAILNLTLLVVIFIDIDHHLILNKITYPLAALGIILSWIPHYPLAEEFPMSFYDSLLGMIFGGGILFLFAVIGKLCYKKEAMGLGDVKLFMAIGAFTGIKTVFYVLLFSSCLGALFGILGLLSGKMKRGSYLPFGPFIVAGVYLEIFLRLGRLLTY